MFDLHVHAAPDVRPRLADDVQILRWYAEAGFTGCVLKSHYDATPGRAAAAARALAAAPAPPAAAGTVATGTVAAGTAAAGTAGEGTAAAGTDAGRAVAGAPAADARAAAAGGARGLRVYGGQALNQHAGGINPAAVAAALAMGARVIWMPTADAHTQRAAGLPRLCCGRPELPDTTYAIPPVDWSAEDHVWRILSLIAGADAVLATGHLSAAEVGWLLDAAGSAGVTRILLTHPGYTVPDISPAETAELTARGACAEITAIQVFDQPGGDAARAAAFVREVGYDRIVLSSDAGQPHNPPPPQALRMLIDALAGEGLDRTALEACASEIPERLVTP